MADVRAVCESSVPQHVCYRTFSRTTLKCHLKEESSRQRSVGVGRRDGVETYDESGLSRLERVAPVRVEIDRREVSRRYNAALCDRCTCNTARDPNERTDTSTTSDCCTMCTVQPSIVRLQTSVRAVTRSARCPETRAHPHPAGVARVCRGLKYAHARARDPLHGSHRPRFSIKRVGSRHKERCIGRSGLQLGAQLVRVDEHEASQNRLHNVEWGCEQAGTQLEGQHQVEHEQQREADGRIL